MWNSTEDLEIPEGTESQSNLQQKTFFSQWEKISEEGYLPLEPPKKYEAMLEIITCSSWLTEQSKSTFLFGGN